jgi:O-antigen ligase
MANTVQKFYKVKPEWGAQAILLAVLFTSAYLINQDTRYGIFIIGLLLLLMIFLIWTTNLSYRNLVITLLVGSFVLPSVPIPGLWTLPVPYILVLFLFPFIVSKFKQRWNWVDICFLLLGFSTLVSLLWGFLFLGVPLEPLRDGMEFVKLFAYWLFFRIGVHAWNEPDLRRIMHWLFLGIGFAIFIGFVQRYNILGSAYTIRTIYGYGAVHIDRVARVIGTMRDPNVFANLMVTGFTLAIGSWKWYRPRIILVLIAAGCVANIIFTISRTGLLALLVAFSVLLLFFLFRLWWKYRWRLIPIGLLVILLTSVVGLIVVDWVNNELSTLREKSTAELVEYSRQGPVNHLLVRFSLASSFTRLEIWQESLGIFLESPVLGWGPGEAIHTSVVDSEYLLYVRRYGLLGLALYFLWYSQIPRIHYRVRRKYPDNSIISGISLSVLAILMAYLVSNIFLSTFYVFQLMSIFWILAGVSYSSLIYKQELIGDGKA